MFSSQIRIIIYWVYLTSNMFGFQFFSSRFYFKVSNFGSLRKEISNSLHSESKDIDLRVNKFLNYFDGKHIKYLIEFRGINDNFRYFEFQNAVKFCCGKVVADSVQFYPIMFDLYTNATMATYFDIDYSLNDNDIKRIVNRCALVRSVIEVWGDGRNPQEVHEQALNNYDHLLRPIFNESLPYAENRWKVEFRRHGRSVNSNYTEKRLLLSKFTQLLHRINGTVDLVNPSNIFVYLEDWMTYQEDLNSLTTELRQNIESNTKINNDSYRKLRIEASEQLEKEYKPLRCILGRLIAEGPNIQHNYDIKRRPYIGQTTMDELSSHLAASSAPISSGSLVLDPYCGTGSLLIAAANLGAMVVGSDVDADCLGLLDCTQQVPIRLRSKNARFRRSTTCEQTQLDLNLYDNFKFYNLQSNVLGFLGIDIVSWLDDNISVIGKLFENGNAKDLKMISINQFPEFDAIITDPPFGVREKACGELQDSDKGDSLISTAYLFAVAIKRLKRNGTLVFYFPSEEDMPRSFIQERLNEALEMAYVILRNKGIHSEREVLVLESFVEDKLHSHISRWLCVYSKSL